MSDSIWHSPSTKEWFMETGDRFTDRTWIAEHVDAIQVTDAHECLAPEFLELLRWRQRSTLGKTWLSDDDKQALAMVLPGLMLIRDSMFNQHAASDVVDETSRTMFAQIKSACEIIGRLI